MKQFVIVTLLTLIPALAFANTGTNGLQKILIRAQESRDARQIAASLPNVEQLWAEDPKQYFYLMHNTARFLEGMSATNIEARQTILILFTNILSKPFSSDNAAAADCIDSQYNAALTCINVVREYGQKPDILYLANFIGGVRSKIIPNYTNKSALNPPGAMDSSPDKEQNAIKKNEENIAMDRLQMTLGLANQLLTPYLFSSCSRFPSDNPTNTDFIEQISNDAHLTDEERKKLKGF
jgi:hypothetical protein